MRKTIFVLTLLLLFLLTACSSETPIPTGNDSENPVFIVSSAEDETVSDPLEQTEKTEENHHTETSLPPANDKETVAPPSVSKPQKDKSKSEASTPPTESAPPPTTESNTPESEQTESSPPPMQRPSGSEVASKVSLYINQYRAIPAAVLPGLNNVALYRANQLVTNFAHSDGIDACNALKYGEFVDMASYGMSASDSYYQGYNREAIAKGNWGGTADEIAQRIAAGFKNSSRHWKYLGSDEYSYIAVGCVYDEASSMWYCCVCVSSKNYGG